MYHGIIIDQEFIDKKYPESFKVFNKKNDGSWVSYGIVIQDNDLSNTIKSIQKNMRTDSAWYAHLYNDKKLIVIFKDKVFNVKPLKSTWQSAIDHGVKLKIPRKQLDFLPTKFKEEKQYFQT